MGEPERIYLLISFGVCERPSVPFGPGTGKELGDTSQDERDRTFAIEKLDEYCGGGITEKLSRKYARRCKVNGAVISSSFLAWQGREVDRKGRFVVNLSKQSKNWGKDRSGWSHCQNLRQR